VTDNRTVGPCLIKLFRLFSGLVDQPSIKTVCQRKLSLSSVLSLFSLEKKEDKEGR
jgi:hypothetical protein